MSAQPETFVGNGLYSVPLAARLARVSSATIHRWLFGYARQRGSDVHEYPPLWKASFAKYRGVGALSFEDLMELRVIAQFLNHGIALAKIREAAIAAKAEFNVDHPFATRLFGTNGWKIIAKLPHAAKSDERGFLDILAQQWMFEEVVNNELLTLDYPENDPTASPFRWWADGRDSEVVVDPQRCFGHPIVTNAGIRTSVLAGMAEENSLEDVADWFGVSRRAAQDAKRFEDRIAQAT